MELTNEAAPYLKLQKDKRINPNIGAHIRYRDMTWNLLSVTSAQKSKRNRLLFKKYLSSHE